MKKGRHRRYEEARKFQRDNAAAFSVENFDFDAPDPFSIRDRESGSFDESSEELTDDISDEASDCLLYTSPSPRDVEESRMPSSA